MRFHLVVSGLTNEDVIDLYNRVKIGAPVVVITPGQGDSPSNPQMAFTPAPQSF